MDKDISRKCSRGSRSTDRVRCRSPGASGGFCGFGLSVLIVVGSLEGGIASAATAPLSPYHTDPPPASHRQAPEKRASSAAERTSPDAKPAVKPAKTGQKASASEMQLQQIQKEAQQ